MRPQITNLRFARPLFLDTPDTRSLMPPASNSAETYDPAFFEKIFKAEQKHFWFDARNRVIRALVRQIIASFSPGYRVLEAGCGTGNVLGMLENECAGGTVIGMDLFEEGLKFARQRTHCQLVLGDVHEAKFDFQFNLIGMFDVLEHLQDDLDVLRDLHRLLLPGGCLLLTVPAHKSLWSYFDLASRHCRRYTAGELRHKLLETGYQVEFISEFMMALFPLAWLSRHLHPTQPTAEANRELAARELRIIPLVNTVMALLLSWEPSWLARRRRLSFGTSILAIARRKA